MEGNSFWVVGFLKTTQVLMAAQLLTFHRLASAHKSRQVLISSDFFFLKEWGFRVDDPAGADDHSGAETLQWV